MRKITAILAFLLFVMVVALYGAFSSYLVVDKNRQLAEQQIQGMQQPSAGELMITAKTIAQSDDFYNIRAEYPQITYPQTTGESEAFNKKIAAAVNNLIDEFKKGAKENWDARVATAPADQAVPQNPEQPFYFAATWMPAQLNDRYASFVIKAYYFSGGAHGNDRIFAFNYDLKNKKEITMADFCGSSENFDKLAKMAQTQIRSQLQAEGLNLDQAAEKWIADGTSASEDNYRNFTFGYGKLTVYFEKYQVGPGAIGDLAAVFLKKDLDESAVGADYFD
ncbi:MAG: DUF3298 and DUF4163 domain-containing protein [Candidatus Pacebacteria bacterium]|nr:DUF3298 and DUF4163 domain-containing protein [Candidatus Paceibacterota bacterium]